MVVVEPAQTKTDMWRAAYSFVEEMAAAMPAETRQLYERHLPGLGKVLAMTSKMAVPPAKVAKPIGRQTWLGQRRPRRGRTCWPGRVLRSKLCAQSLQ